MRWVIPWIVILLLGTLGAGWYLLGRPAGGEVAPPAAPSGRPAQGTATTVTTTPLAPAAAVTARPTPARATPPAVAVAGGPSPPGTPSRAVTPNPPPTPALTPGRAPGEVTVELDEATLTQQANASLAGQSLGDTPLGPAAVRSVALQLRDGQIRASGTAQVGPSPLPFSLAGTVTTEGGRMRVTLTDARLSNLPMPASARRYVEETLQAQVDSVVARQRVRVRTVTVADGKLTIVGAPV